MKGLPEGWEAFRGKGFGIVAMLSRKTNIGTLSGFATKRCWRVWLGLGDADIATREHGDGVRSGIAEAERAILAYLEGKTMATETTKGRQEMETTTTTPNESATAKLLRQSMGMVDEQELAAVIREWAFVAFAKGAQAAEAEGVPPVFSCSVIDGFDSACEFGIESMKDEPSLRSTVDALETIRVLMRAGGQANDE